MSLQGQLTGSQTEYPRVLLLDVLMEVLEGGYWPLLMLVTLVRAGLMPAGWPCSCSLQLYSPCQGLLVCCGYRNRSDDPSLLAWLCLAATVSVVSRISPELSLKLLLWLSVLIPLSTGGKNLLYHYLAQLGGAGQGEETVAGTETSHFLPFLCYFSTSGPLKTPLTISACK